MNMTYIKFIDNKLYMHMHVEKMQYTIALFRSHFEYLN